MKHLILFMTCLAALTACALPGPEAFKVNLAGVAAIGMNESPRSAKPQLPDRRLVVAPGQVALFLLEYSFPPEFKSRIYLTANGRLRGAEVPFGYSGSAAHSGNGKLMPVLFLPPESCTEPLLLKSVRLEGEIVSQKGAPRNKPFFLRDIPVEVLFTPEAEPDPARIVTLEPSPAPARDPAIGIVTVEEIPFMTF